MSDANPESTPLELGQAAAAQFGGTAWELDAEVPGLTVEEPPAALDAAPPSNPKPPTAFADEPPPSPEQIVEAMLFVGGHPLTAAVARSAVRGLTPERFQDAV